MNLSEILNKIHLIYEGDTNYPTSGSEDYEARKALANAAIDVWQNENVRWRELFKNLADATTGDKTASTSTTVYSVPNDYRFISSFLYIEDSTNNRTYYAHVRPDVRIETLAGKRLFFETGGGNAKKINIINPINGTIHYYYYKKAAKLSGANDVPEMLVPDFVVYWVMAQLYEQDLRGDKVAHYLNLAKEAMDYMVVENESRPFYHAQQLPDFDYASGFSFGL